MLLRIIVLTTTLALNRFVNAQNQIWANWGPWQQCSKPCGYGIQSRTRGCAPWSGQVCSESQSRSCNESPCSNVQGSFPSFEGQVSTSGWGQWSQCSSSCGGGSQTRVFASPTQRRSETRFCNPQWCDTQASAVTGDGWGQWSTCSAPCGGGTQTRVFTSRLQRRSETRSCNIDRCSSQGPTSTSGWTQWSECSASCGGGRQNRQLTIGFQTRTETRGCNMQGCAIQRPAWSNWSSWNACSKTCGGGVSSRSRSCLHNIRSQCVGNPSGLRTCATHQCPPEWSKWSRWSSCSKTCGVGERRRTRTCGKGKTSCSGNGIQKNRCQLGVCKKATKRTRLQRKPKPVKQITVSRKPHWARWGKWVSCSETCGRGARLRVRRCRYGRSCEGKNIDVAECQIKKCYEDPEWGAWSTWSECSASCGKGARSRKRECSDPGECRGNDSESGQCYGYNCPKKPTWLGWSQCTATCGGGIRIRTRTCDGRSSKCLGSNVESDSCNTADCIQAPTWNNWGAWSECTKSCGEGSTTRKRQCSDESRNCKGNPTESKPCNTVKCAPEWNDWGEWSKCTATCDEASRIRRRTCKGQVCPGRSVAREICELNSCPIQCAKIRNISGGKVVGEKNVYDSGDKVSFECEPGRQLIGVANSECTVHGDWTADPPVCIIEFSKWQRWSECDVTCGGGLQSRRRICHVIQCDGKLEETQSCNTNKCPAIWTEWVSWTVCTATCGGGARIRTRECESISDEYNCLGKTTETDKCNREACPKEKAVSVWGDWSTWTECSKTCGGGSRMKERQCEGGMESCNGEGKESEPCNTEKCAPEWNDWSPWSKCDATCGPANRVRLRSCKSEGCDGSGFERDTCKLQTCPKQCSDIRQIDDDTVLGKKASYFSGDKLSFKCNPNRKLVGPTHIKCTPDGEWTSEPPTCVVEWSDWQTWSECTFTCGEGSQSRKRLCNLIECDGDTREVRSCNTEHCPASWTEWVSWSDCTVDCGGGARIRTRICESETEENDCSGDSVETDVCNENTCPEEEIRCDETKPPLNGKVVVVKNGNNRIGTILSFKCDAGYALRGGMRIFCKKNAKWSRTAPFCSAKKCPRSKTPTHACVKSCVKASQCAGISRFCLCDGECGMSCFDHNKECGAPENPQYGHAVYDEIKYGYKAKYVCDPGFVLVGSSTRICQSNGNWSGPTPTCQVANTCGQAGDVGDIFSTAGGRIVGGKKAKTGAWPWQGMIVSEANDGYVTNSFAALRGGFTILNQRWILSAAHIYDGLTTRSLKLLLYIVGITTKPTEDKLPDNAQAFRSSEILIHPKYNQKKFYDYDIALIKTGAKMIVRKGVYIQTEDTLEIDYNRDVRPVCLPCWTKPNVTTPSTIQASSFSDDHCIEAQRLNAPGHVVVTGFGKTSMREDNLPEDLKQARLTIEKDSECKIAARKIRSDPQFSKARFTSRMMCTRSGSKHVQMDACSGDSGGPLVRLIKNEDGSTHWVQVGIVSWGYGCAYVEDDFEYPGYFTRLTEVMDFIGENAVYS